MTDEVIVAPCDMPEIEAKAGDTLVIRRWHPSAKLIVGKAYGDDGLGVLARYGITPPPGPRPRRLSARPQDRREGPRLTIVEG